MFSHTLTRLALVGVLVCHTAAALARADYGPSGQYVPGTVDRDGIESSKRHSEPQRLAVVKDEGPSKLQRIRGRTGALVTASAPVPSNGLDAASLDAAGLDASTPNSTWRARHLRAPPR